MDFGSTSLEKNKEEMRGPGRGPKPRVENPWKIIRRLSAYVLKDYALAVIVVLVVVIVVMAVRHRKAKAELDSDEDEEE